MQFFKRIIIIARNNGILVGDPFASYKIRLEKVDRGYLTEDEIKIILKKKMVSERLEHVRDLFVFSCFCSLAKRTPSRRAANVWRTISCS